MNTSSLKRALLLVLCMSAGTAYADNTDVANSPIVTSATADVRPNFMFILDDSGSMDFDFLPDWINYGNDAKYCKADNGTATVRCCPNGSNGRCLQYQDGKNDTPPFNTGTGAPRPGVPFAASAFNRIYYDPAVVYTPPKKADGTSYSSMDSTNTSGWASVPMDGYSVQDVNRNVDLTSKYPETLWCDSSDLNACTYNSSDYVQPNTLFGYFYGSYTAPYYYAIVPGEYCDSSKLTNCTVSSTPTGTYTQAAYVRWCSDSALTNCQALRNSTYKYARYPTVNPDGNNAVLYTVSGNSTASNNRSATVSSISVATGTAVLGTATAASQNVDTVTDLIIANINTSSYQVTTKLCTTASSTRTCKFLVIAKYAASCPKGSTSASVTNTGSGTAIAVSAGSSFTGKCPVPGAFSRVNIVPGNDSYAYPGSATKHPNRSDCAGDTCTYAEEMTNFANWFAYYRTRMQMMKTSASLAFNNIDDTYRVGYFSINNNTTKDFLNISTFDSTQKTAWYNRVLHAYPGNGTPLRSALSTAGLLYAGVLNGATFNGSTVKDPVEYSCQKNFTLLSTDGYWNTGNDSGCSGRNGQGCQLDKTSAVGNTDGSASRPYNDGQLNYTTYQTVTSGPSTTTTVNQTDTVVTVYQRNSYISPTSSGCWGGKVKSRWYEQQMTSTLTEDKDIATSNIDGSTKTETYVDGVLQSSTTTSSPTTTTTTTVNSSSTVNGEWANTSSLISSKCSYSYHDSGDIGPAAAISQTTTITSGPTEKTSVSDPTVTTTGPTLINQSTSGGVSNTLADVAYYYYQTDLRTNGSTGANGIDVGTDNNVPSTSTDTASYQHMTTFTLGLGVDGYMQYANNYATASNGDYFDIKNAQLSSSTHCTWETSGATCNWPIPASDSQANIDDLWHAAVNGRGSYFSAKNPSELSASLAQVLTAVKSVTGAAAAATTSTPTITAGDNFLFASTFQTYDWTGELSRYSIDVLTGDISATADWSAAGLLDAKTSASSDARTIYMFNSDDALTSTCGTALSAGTKLKPFCWTGSGSAYGSDTSLTDAERAYFGALSINALTQSCATGTYVHPSYATTRNCLSDADKTAAAGKNLVNFLRGQTGHEDSASASAGEYFRNRAHVLGDLVSSEAVYVKKPLRNYSDAGFSAFQTANANRKAMVYISGNDGMLHAFNAGSGQEEWAYIPTMVLPNLYKLADVNYPNNHKFFVDGTLVVRDAYFGGSWKTLLVGGLGAGGSGFYALDVTNPDTPKALWEFKSRSSSCASTTAAAIGDSTDCDLGLSFGNPIVTKLENGTWVVLVTSGYNNATSGSGEGYLYVLDAQTGTILNKIGTGAGSTGAYSTCSTPPCPSGLSRIEAWIDDVQTNNTADRVYGGDLFGNIWRFDLNDKYEPDGSDAFKVAVLTGPNDELQPVTTKIGLAEYNHKAILLVGTGRFMGLSDAAAEDMLSPNLQTFWGFQDKISTSGWTGWGKIRDQNPAPVKQTLTNGIDPDTGDAVRYGSSNPVDFDNVPGWYIDLPDNGERVNTDPLVVFDQIIFSSNVPLASACTTGGYSYLNILGISTGSGKSKKTSNALSSRPTAYQDEGGNIKINRSLSTGKQETTEGPPPGSGDALKRVSWRLLQSND